MDPQTWKDRILLAIVPRVSSLLLRLLSLTLRKEVRHRERVQAFWDRGESIIGAFWHQRLLLMPFLPRQGRVGMLISQHRDGELIARTVRYLGIESVRGSTTRASLSALRGMIRFHRTGANLAITPDGPQGPKHVVQMGVIELARQTAAPLLPVTYNASRRIVFDSWDNFILPLPFSRAVYLWGEPVRVPRDCSPEEMEQKRLLLQTRLRQISEEADRFFQKEGRPHSR